MSNCQFYIQVLHYLFLEAMACCCPVISSNTSSMTEILSNACLYFNPYDVNDISEKMKCVLENKNLQLKLREKGLIRAKLFTREKMTKNILKLFSLSI